MPAPNWFYSRSSVVVCLAVLLLVVSVTLGEENTQITKERTKRAASRPILVARGEKLPLYSVINDPDAPTLVDGIRTLGEWMKTVGLFEEEPSFVESHLDPSEPFELELEDSNVESEQFHTLTRDSTLLTTANAAPSIPRIPVICSRRGVLVNKTGPVDKCHGYNCYIASMICEGVLYSGDSLFSFMGSMDRCEVLSLRCPNGVDNPVFPQSCPIQKFLCPNNQTKLPSELGGQSFENCNVQVFCPSEGGAKNTFYGYEAFDFECTNQQLVCDGVVVESPNGHQAANGTCSIQPIPCQSVANVTSLCNRIEKTCGTSPTNNLCSSLVNHTVTCSSNSPHVYAAIDSITCGSETHDYATWNGSIASCTSIRSVRQGDDIFTLPFNSSSNSYCILSELDCNGIRTPWNFTARVPDGCGVSRIVCGDRPDLTWPPKRPACTSHDFGCHIPATTCTFAETRFPCATRCRQPGLSLQCDCPVDWTGKVCETPRSMKCSFNVTEAQIRRDGSSTTESYGWRYNCPQDLQKRQLGEPVCFPIMQSDKLLVTGRLNCSFTDGSLSSLLSTLVTDFNYTVFAENFRLSNVTYTPIWVLYMKAINFNSFTDFGGSAKAILTHGQMAGNDTIAFEIHPSAIHERYKAGGRIRMEWKFVESYVSPRGMDNNFMYGSTIDIMDWHQQYPKQKGKVNFTILSVSLLSIFAVCVAALFAYRYYKKKRQEAESRER